MSADTLKADALSGGFADPVFEAQGVFRCVLDATASPGTIRPLPTGVRPPAPLSATAGAVLLALADADTPVWLDAPLAAVPAVADWIRFHANAPLTDDPAAADFAVIANPAAMPSLESFALGLQEYPDRSTTLILQVSSLGAEGGFELSGPGIETTVSLEAAPLPAGFAAQFRANRELFPRGVDLLLVTADSVAALPRSVRLTEREI